LVAEASRTIPASLSARIQTSRGRPKWKLTIDGLSSPRFGEAPGRRPGGDRAAEVAQNIALEKLQHIGCQVFRTRGRGKGGNTCDRRSRFQRLWIGHFRSAPEWGHGRLLESEGGVHGR